MTDDTQLAPTDAEIDAIVYEHTGFDGDGTQPMTADEMRRVSRAVLTRWGQPAHSGKSFQSYGETRAYSKGYYAGKKAALASQPAHSGEPVATVGSWTNGSYSRNYKITWHRDVPEGTKLYTAPQSVEREPLPPDELMRIIMEVEQQHNFLRGTTNWAAAVGRAIERAHGITKGGQHGTE